MEIVTKAHGKIEITEDRLITIPEGLFGFEEYTKYALVDSDYEPFLWLQSCEDSNLAFLIVDPFLICNEYETSSKKWKEIKGIYFFASNSDNWFK